MSIPVLFQKDIQGVIIFHICCAFFIKYLQNRKETVGLIKRRQLRRIF